MQTSPFSHSLGIRIRALPAAEKTIVDGVIEVKEPRHILGVGPRRGPIEDDATAASFGVFQAPVPGGGSVFRHRVDLGHRIANPGIATEEGDRQGRKLALFCTTTREAGQQSLN